MKGKSLKDFIATIRGRAKEGEEYDYDVVTIEPAPEPGVSKGGEPVKTFFIFIARCGDFGEGICLNTKEEGAGAQQRDYELIRKFATLMGGIKEAKKSRLFAD